MMFFVNAAHKVAYPVRLVKRVDLDASDRGLRRVVLEDGQDVWVYPGTADDIIGYAPGTIIPALAGTYLLGADFSGEDGAHIWRALIIAWRISSHDGPVPITADGEYDGMGSAGGFILMPDGVVVSPAYRTWENFGEFEKWAAALHVEKSQERQVALAATGARP